MKIELVKADIDFDREEGYGIRADLGGEIKTYRGLSMDQERVRKLVESINRCGVSSLHLDEIIEDFLG